jgi:predicted amidophosphoribosyltransferase
MLIGKYNMDDIENIDLDDIFETIKRTSDSKYDEESSLDKNILNNRDFILSNYKKQKKEKKKKNKISGCKECVKSVKSNTPKNKVSGCNECAKPIKSVESKTPKNSKKSKILKFLLILLVIIVILTSFILIPKYYGNKSFEILNVLTDKMSEFKNFFTQYYKKLTVKQIV